MTQEEREVRDMRKATKRLKRDEKKRNKKMAEEAVGVSKSSAPLRGPTSDPVPFEIPPI